MPPKILFAAVALTGCTTSMHEISQHAPRATYTSARSLPALEQCLAERLSWLAAPSVIRGETDTLVSFTAGGTTPLLLSLRPAPNGTTVEVRQVLTYGSRIRNNVETCVSA